MKKPANTNRKIWWQILVRILHVECLTESIICSIRLLKKKNIHFGRRLERFSSRTFLSIIFRCLRECVYTCVYWWICNLVLFMYVFLIRFLHFRSDLTPNSMRGGRIGRLVICCWCVFVVNFDFDPLRFVVKMQTHV